jgi:ribosomal protein S18 acetylase RimI-like enzyme
MTTTQSQPPAITIRRAKQEDLAAITALDAAVTGVRKADYWDDVYERFGRSRQRERAFLVAETSEEPTRVVGAIVGEVRAWEFGSPPCGWVFAIQVDPAVRQGGVGSRLFEAMVEVFRKAGVAKVRTMMARDNHLVMAFFRSQGMMAGPYLQLEMELEAGEGAP